MAATIREKINGVLEFLEQDILPDISRNHRSELRAALKLLATLREEIDLLPMLLVHESATLLQLAEATLPHIVASARGDLSIRLERLREGAKGGPATLAQLEAARASLRVLVADIAIALSHDRASTVTAQAADAALLAINRQLGADAEVRTSFQSVFQFPLYAAAAPLNGTPS